MKYLIPLFCIVLVGCTSTEAIKTGKSFPATNPENVEILFDYPTRPFVDVALLTGSGGTFTNQNDVMEDMKNEAAKLGADAIYLSGGMSSHREWTGNANVPVRKVTTGQARAIKWK